MAQPASRPALSGIWRRGSCCGSEHSPRHSQRQGRGRVSHCLWVNDRGQHHQAIACHPTPAPAAFHRGGRPHKPLHLGGNVGSLATNQPGPTQTIAPWGPLTAAAGHREASFVGARLLWRKGEVKQGVAKINQGKSWKRDFAKQFSHRWHIAVHQQVHAGHAIESSYLPDASPRSQLTLTWGGMTSWDPRTLTEFATCPAEPGEARSQLAQCGAGASPLPPAQTREGALRAGESAQETGYKWFPNWTEPSPS
ncbi:unnamed protein product [Natator depressus]